MTFDRVKVRPNDDVFFKHHYQWDGGASPPGNLYRSVPDNTMQGETIPHFHSKRKRGELLPHTAFSQFEVEEIDFSGFDMSFNADPGGTDHWFDDHILWEPGGVRVWHSPDASGAQAEIQRAAANINSAGFDALTSLAELRKSATMLQRFANRLGKLLSHRGRVLTGKQIAQAWLEGRYGWRTLAFEVRDLNDAITEFDAKRTMWSERSGFSYQEGHSGIMQLVDHHIYGKIEAEYVVTTTHSIRGSVTAQVQPARFTANPLVTGWELTPFSYIVDWALTVGNAIEAFNLVAAADGVSASWGTKSTTSFEGARPYHTQQPNFGTATVSGGSWRYVVSSSQRYPSDVPLTPQISGRALAPSQLLDLTSLMRARSRF